jgi:predicted tellurium resistance membrane protein TerC
LEFFVSFLTLSILEIILGIDNIILLSLIVLRITNTRTRSFAKYFGLAFALILRIIMLSFLVYLVKYLKTPLWVVGKHPIFAKEIVMGLGGIFLIFKTYKEMRQIFLEKRSQKEQEQEVKKTFKKRPGLFFVILEIAFLDFVFSFDSIITAIGISDHLGVMILANVVAIILMLIFVNIVSGFIQKHPSIKVLGICFMGLIGIVLTLDSFGLNISKNYLYFAVLFSLTVEGMNIALNQKDS